jgi:NADPH-dependent glutamate synthase beta subunit-like oxidoreductase
VDIEGYLTLLRDGRIDEACDLLLRENPIPAVTGRVCDHPCEGRCNRAGFDGAVAIHAIERMLGDRILAGPLPTLAARRHAECIAIIGTGPAGMACAYHLVRLGYTVEMFDQAAEPGGMLRQGIPAYRLPRAVLDREFRRLEALGVVVHCDAPVGRSPTWKALTAGHDAVFVGIGAQRGRRLGVPGEDLAGVRQGLEFLRSVNAGNGGRRSGSVGRHVVVIGGGNTAMDCARTALRMVQRGGTVTVLYRRGRAEMPAIPDEVADAEREGTRFVFLVAPVAIEKANNGLVVVSAPMRLGEPDASGRRQPVPSGDPPVRTPADTVLLAIGEEVALDGIPVSVQPDGSVKVDPWGGVRTGGAVAVFGGGDVTGDQRTVAHALGAGKRAAIGIDRYLRLRRGENGSPPTPDPLRIAERGALSVTRWRRDDPVRRVAPVNTVVRYDELNTADFAPLPRHVDRHAAFGNGHGTDRAAGANRTDRARAGRFAEVNLGLTAEAALAEARRCFQCGVCNGCELCLIYCADVAITRAGGDRRFDINLDYCKGCGVCAAECPRGAITMTRDGAET